jgi:hypothetical protein
LFIRIAASIRAKGADVSNLTVYKIGTDKLLVWESVIAWLVVGLLLGFKAGLHWALCIVVVFAGLFVTGMVIRNRAVQHVVTAVITVFWTAAIFQITREFNPDDWIAPVAMGLVAGFLSLIYHLRAFRYRREVEEV